MTGRVVEAAIARKCAIFLHRLVVIGHDREHCVGAGAFGLPRQLDRAIGRIGSGARNDAGTALHGLDGAGVVKPVAEVGVG
ncbi:hypothetical protein V1294_006684 [Bradyrhizobium sp. AZCC 1678]